MYVYIVSRICDYEHLCREVVFVTDNEETAKEYCKKHNKKIQGWDGKTYNEIIYKDYYLKN